MSTDRNDTPRVQASQGFLGSRWAARPCSRLGVLCVGPLEAKRGAAAGPSAVAPPNMKATATRRPPPALRLVSLPLPSLLPLHDSYLNGGPLSVLAARFIPRP